jgi:predicted DNA-binding protein
MTRKLSQVEAGKRYDLNAPLVSFRLLAEYHEKAERIAKERGVSKADVFREILIQFLS